MKSNFYKILDFSVFKSSDGALVMLQGQSVMASKKLPFNIKRVLIIKDMDRKSVRGGHTHHKTRQFLLVISGGCIVDLDNGKNRESIKLDKPNRGILLEPYVWHVMKGFKSNTILLVLADTEYNEKDYIRDYEEFLKCIK